MSNNITAISTYNKTYEDVYKLTYPHNKKYFDKYHIQYNPIFMECSGAEKYYTKFNIINNLMHNDHNINYIFAMDIDIVICNFDIDLRHIINMTDKDLLFCSVMECSPDMYWNINSGSIIIKNSIKARELMNNYIEIAKSIDFRINDQVLWQNLLKLDANFRNNTCVFPANTFNAGGQNFFLHHELSASSTRMPAFEACRKKIEILRRTIEQISYE